MNAAAQSAQHSPLPPTSKTEELLRLVEQRGGTPDIYAALRKLPTGDLTTLLTSLFEERARTHAPKELVKRYQQNRFTQPSDVDPIALNQLEGRLFNAMPPEFRAIVLSPVCNQGAVSTISPVSQKTILPSVRALEVLSDVTTSLAIEAGKRRAELMGSKDPALRQRCVHLCAHGRPLRVQAFTPELKFTPHFSVFGAVSAQCTERYYDFIVESAVRHLAFYLTVLTDLKDSGADITEISVAFSDVLLTEQMIKSRGADRDLIVRQMHTPGFDLCKTLGLDSTRAHAQTWRDATQLLNSCEIPAHSILERVESEVIGILRARFPCVQFSFDVGRTAGLGYYEDLAMKISAKTASGLSLPLVDGGATRWLGRMLSNENERIFTSGIGTELLAKFFLPKTTE